MKIKFLALLLCCLPFLSGCNDEDNIKEIFLGKTWHLNGFYITKNWDKVNASVDVTTGAESNQINRPESKGLYVITFSEANTFVARGSADNFSGTWEANGKSRELTMKITGGTASGDNISTQMISRIKEAGFYRGDAMVFKIFAKDKRSFMEFYVKK